MARINKTRINFKKLDSLIKSLDKNVSIRVGIIGAKAQEIHPDSNLTNAELGAVHEFGVTIQVTDKMRRYLHSQGLHLSPETTTVTIPTRSFLRMPLLSDEGKKAVKKEFMELAKEHLGEDELNLIAYGGDEQWIKTFAEGFGATAVKRVQEAFMTGGFGSWEPITEFTKKRRKGDPENPPLQNQGDLMNAISSEVKIQ